MFSVLSIFIPAAFFAALDNGQSQSTLVSDASRGHFLVMSRGIAIVLLCMCVPRFLYLELLILNPNYFFFTM